MSERQARPQPSRMQPRPSEEPPRRLNKNEIELGHQVVDTSKHILHPDDASMNRSSLDQERDPLLGSIHSSHTSRILEQNHSRDWRGYKFQGENALEKYGTPVDTELESADKVDSFFTDVESIEMSQAHHDGSGEGYIGTKVLGEEVSQQVLDYAPFLPVVYDTMNDTEDEDEDDRQSIQSANSSTTLLSTLSGYTAVEMEGATIELQKVFQQDTGLIKLYQKAVGDKLIGPQRLQRNLERLLRRMARDLRLEADKELEKLTSRFVSMKAEYVAHCIVEDCHCKPITVSQRVVNGQDDSADEVEVREQPGGEDLDHIEPIDEDHFEDLAVFRNFLVQSAAFQSFRDRLTLFVIPKETRSLNTETQSKDSDIKKPGEKSQAAWNSIYRMYQALIRVAGLVELPLQSNLIRVRWQCRCGDHFSSRVQEYRPEGIGRLQRRMQRSGCLNVTFSDYSQDSTETRYTVRCPAWLRSACRSLSSILSVTSKETMCLPQHHASSKSNSATAPRPSLST
ncbi:hypothetical protein C7974DRAFT_234926 [Boeremia exigua]|uniref:uncharacterized protein n=1 Tax=Boeremia exigua TaxID=749465 RepID=UPI001E8D143C|nr:uncharacterized protein C7974DRAFT_234926 [Boeremia exigua]KAH6620474.1 hypothetical protein C7974DRAFT_234926 [Boeremia exigua]